MYYDQNYFVTWIFTHSSHGSAAVGGSRVLTFNDEPDLYVMHKTLEQDNGGYPVIVLGWFPISAKQAVGYHRYVKEVMGAGPKMTVMHLVETPEDE
jgi:hypothetical protein